MRLLGLLTTLSLAGVLTSPVRGTAQEEAKGAARPSDCNRQPNLRAMKYADALTAYHTELFDGVPFRLERGIRFARSLKYMQPHLESIEKILAAGQFPLPLYLDYLCTKGILRHSSWLQKLESLKIKLRFRAKMEYIGRIISGANRIPEVNENGNQFLLENTRQLSLRCHDGDFASFDELFRRLEHGMCCQPGLEGLLTRFYCDVYLMLRQLLEDVRPHAYAKSLLSAIQLDGACEAVRENVYGHGMGLMGTMNTAVYGSSAAVANPLFSTVNFELLPRLLETVCNAKKCAARFGLSLADYVTELMRTKEIPCHLRHLADYLRELHEDSVRKDVLDKELSVIGPLRTALYVSFVSQLHSYTREWISCHSAHEIALLERCATEADSPSSESHVHIYRMCQRYLGLLGEVSANRNPLEKSLLERLHSRHGLYMIIESKKAAAAQFIHTKGAELVATFQVLLENSSILYQCVELFHARRVASSTPNPGTDEPGPVDLGGLLDSFHMSFLDGKPAILKGNWTMSSLLEDSVLTRRVLSFAARHDLDLRKYLAQLCRSAAIEKVPPLAELRAKKRTLFENFNLVVMLQESLGKMEQIIMYLPVSDYRELDYGKLFSEFFIWITVPEILQPPLATDDLKKGLENLRLLARSPDPQSIAEFERAAREMVVLCRTSLSQVKDQCGYLGNVRKIKAFQKSFLDCITEDEVFGLVSAQSDPKVCVPIK